MLSIKSMTGVGVGDYYLSLAREDYYLESGEPPGEWLGSAKDSLAMRGNVSRESLRATLNGLNVNTGAKLAQNAGDPSRHSGWDLTFSAPKSISVLWALGSLERRKIIEDAHKQAVATVIKIIEEHAIITRRGKGGAILERGKIIAASFVHGTSRALDPQLHSHVLVSNLCERTDGSWGTIVGRELYKRKMALGALYRAELSAALSRSFKLSWVRKGNLMEASEVSEKLLALFAKRRAAIAQLLESRGLKSAKASERAALDTRTEKQVASRSELYEAWNREVAGAGLAPPEVTERKKKGVFELKVREICKGLVSTLLDKQSFFSTWDAVRIGAENSLGSGEGARSVLKRVQTFLKEDSELVYLGDERKESVFTSKAMFRAEDELLSMFGGNKGHEIRAKVSVNELSKINELNGEQLNGLTEIASGKSLSIVSGLAGTGKSRLLKSVRTFYESAGFTVIGAAIAGKAAEGLESETGIKSQTLQSLLKGIRSGRVLLNSRTLVVIDEAGMVGTLMMRELAGAIIGAGAKLSLIGDERQLQPIAAGGPFQALRKLYGGAELLTIRRQRSSWDRERILELIRGAAEKAFAQYAAKGRLVVGETALSLREQLIGAWSRGGLKAPELNLILASENAKVEELNAEAQKLRLVNSEVSGPSLTTRAGSFFVKDRVLFTRNSRLIGVKNGSLGTVEMVQRREGKLRVRLDSGALVRVHLEKFPHVKLGYAVTTHKAQGLTAENVFVYLGGSLQDRETSYVQASRARGDTHFFVSKDEAGDKLKRIAFLASESHIKRLAHQIKSSLKVRV